MHFEIFLFLLIKNMFRVVRPTCWGRISLRCTVDRVLASFVAVDGNFPIQFNNLLPNKLIINFIIEKKWKKTQYFYLFFVSEKSGEVISKRLDQYQIQNFLSSDIHSNSQSANNAENVFLFLANTLL